MLEMVIHSEVFGGCVDDIDALVRVVPSTDSLTATLQWLYNRRSELVGASGTQTHPYDHAYSYDSIGNRLTASDDSGIATYVANSLNQYTAVNRTIDQLVLRSFSEGGSNNFIYDADGNLTQDDRFDYAYDDENRLLSVTPINPVYGDCAIENAYDHRNRRVKKIVKRHDGTSWNTAETHVFVWDGWNIVFEKIILADSTTRTIEYYWGNDLSGTEEGAGGVGGLLATRIDGVFYVPVYGANGNVMMYVSESGSIAAQYDYDPYGNILQASGPLASQFAFGFSTKYHDREVGLVAYQLRTYNPTHGRWLNRDPIEENGGVNLYVSCNNNFLNSYDLIGLWSSTWASRGEKRRVYKKEKGDTIKGLADELGLDGKTFHLWAKIETLDKASEDKPGKSAPSSDDGLKGVCYISVPNVWIEADLLRGGGIYDHVVVNQGGTIGSFFGQTLGRWGYHTLKPGTPSDLLKTVNANIKDIYGLTVYAHGSPNGYIVAPDRKSAIHQTRLIAAFRSNGYRIARANMMQCYSIKTDGTIPTGPKTEKTYNYKEAWEKTAVKVYGYEGVNAIGIDFK